MSLKEFEDFIDNQTVDDYIVRIKQRYDSDTKWEYINTLLLYGDDAEPYYHWNDDWWEGQQHVEILGYIAVHDLNEGSFNSL